MKNTLKDWYDNTEKTQAILNKLSHKDLKFLLARSGVLTWPEETKSMSIRKMFIVLHIDIPNKYQVQ